MGKKRKITMKRIVKSAPNDVKSLREAGWDEMSDFGNENLRRAIKEARDHVRVMSTPEQSEELIQMLKNRKTEPPL